MRIPARRIWTSSFVLSNHKKVFKIVTFYERQKLQSPPFSQLKMAATAYPARTMVETHSFRAKSRELRYYFRGYKYGIHPESDSPSVLS